MYEIFVAMGNTEMQQTKRNSLLLSFLFSLFILTVPLFLLFLAYETTAFNAKYYAAEDQQVILGFLRDNSNKQELSVNMTEAERVHLEDVKKVMYGADIAFYAISAAFLILFAFFYFSDKRLLQKGLFIGGVATLVLIASLALFARFYFAAAFSLFHQPLFAAGTWLFPADSTLIVAFPFAFFETMARAIFVKSFLYGILIIMLSVYIKKRLKKEKHGIQP